LKAVQTAITKNRVLRFNQYLDAVVAGTFMILVALVFLLSLYEWSLLIARKRAADLFETPPSWLPDYAIVEGRPANALGYVAILFGLARELSGQAEVERAQTTHCACIEAHEKKSESEIYVAATEARYKSIHSFFVISLRNLQTFDSLPELKHCFIIGDRKISRLNLAIHVTCVCFHPGRQHCKSPSRKCHSERSEESRIKFVRITKGDRQRCFASLNMTAIFLR